MLTPFLETYLQECQFMLADELEEARRDKKKRPEQEMLKATWMLHMDSVRRADILIVRRSSIPTVEEQLDLLAEEARSHQNFLAPHDAWITPDRPGNSIIVEFEDTLEHEAYPFAVKALHFHERNYTQRAGEIAEQLPTEAREKILMHNAQVQGTTWTLDCVSSHRAPPLNQRLCFTCAYNGERWYSEGPYHLCPWSRCKANPMCKPCQSLLQTLVLYFCVTLQAAAGTFQEVLPKAPPESERRTGPVNGTPIAGKQHNRVRYINVRERHLNHTHSSERTQGTRMHWLHFHGEEEIEMQKK